MFASKRPAAWALVAWPLFFSAENDNLRDKRILELGIAPKESECASAPVALKAELVRSEAARERGLMGKGRKLKKDEGMAFVFSPPRPAIFWMKDTHLPLDVAYFTPEGKLERVLQMKVEPNPSQPTQFYASSGLTSVALEANWGALESRKLPAGSVLCAGFAGEGGSKP